MNMILLCFVLFIALMLFAAHIAEKLKEKTNRNYLPYVKREYLMSVAERTFYEALVKAVGDKYHVIPQVVLCNIVGVSKYEKRKRTYRNLINRRVLDFVLFEKPYFIPQLVIELDDRSHLDPQREDRDMKVDAILTKAGIRIEHIKNAYSYDIEALKSRISL